MYAMYVDASYNTPFLHLCQFKHDVTSPIPRAIIIMPTGLLIIALKDKAKLGTPMYS
jgi:hypothetical protein